MEKNLVAKYKKVYLGNNMYLYIFAKILEDVDYDYLDDTVTYQKKNQRKKLYSIEDPYFTISDEKDCYCDYFTVEDLMQTYNTDDKIEILDHFKKDCSCFLRIGILDPEKEIVTIVNADMESIKNAEPDSHFYEFTSTINPDYENVITIPEETLNSLIKTLEANEASEVLQKFYEMRDSIKLIKEMIEQYSINEDVEIKKEEPEVVNEKENIEDILMELNSLIGLENIKKQVSDLKKYLKFTVLTNDYLNLDDTNLNMIFYGNPGTGKTTIARLLGRIFYELGYVKKNIFKETTAQDFIDGYIGQTAIKAKKLLDENRGGVIFIDEAYVFASKAQEFASEALVEILKELEKKETIFIFAGYKDEMKHFIDMNPGLESRIGYYFDFKDFSLDELFEIFMLKINKSKFLINNTAKEEVKKIIEKKMNESNKDNFGNGRYIDKLFDKIVMEHAVNVDGIQDKKILKTITKTDVKSAELETMDLKVKQKKLGF